MNIQLPAANAEHPMNASEIRVLAVRCLLFPGFLQLPTLNLQSKYE
jgi:hypothetical protein